MKEFHSDNCKEKLTKHLINIIILSMLIMVGCWYGDKYEPNYSPYMFAYMLPSVVAGLVFCTRFSDNVWRMLHPHSTGRVNVYHYGDDYDPAMSIVGDLKKYLPPMTSCYHSTTKEVCIGFAEGSIPPEDSDSNMWWFDKESVEENLLPSISHKLWDE